MRGYWPTAVDVAVLDAELPLVAAGGVVVAGGATMTGVGRTTLTVRFAVPVWPDGSVTIY